MQRGVLALEDLVARLTPALGEEKSAEAVTAAARSLGLHAPTLTERDALALFDVLAAAPGMLGTAARFARQRFVAERRPEQEDEVVQPPAPSVERPRADRPEPRAGEVLTLRQLVGAFAASLGEEKARESVLGAMERLSIDPQQPLTQEHGLRVLEDLAQSGGLVAVTARFAKARLILRK